MSKSARIPDPFDICMLLNKSLKDSGFIVRSLKYDMYIESSSFTERIYPADNWIFPVMYVSVQGDRDRLVFSFMNESTRSIKCVPNVSVTLSAEQTNDLTAIGRLIELATELCETYR